VGWRGFFIGWLCLILFSTAAASPPDRDEPEEMLLELRVQNQLVFDFDGMLYRGELYLPLTALLSALRIEYDTGNRGSRVDLRHPNGNNDTRIDFSRSALRTPQGTETLSDTDWFEDNGEFYLHEQAVATLLNATVRFNYQRLEVSLSSRQNFPVVEDFRRQQQHEALTRSEPELIPDGEIAPRRYLARGGRLNWSANTSYSAYRQHYGYRLSYGGQVFGGEANLSFRGSDTTPVNPESIRGDWRFPIYNTSLIRQVTIGDLHSENIYGNGHLRYQGIEITNRPNASRRLFGTFSRDVELQPGENVEFYHRREMTGFGRGIDDSEYQFAAPIRYGSNRYSIRHFSPEGRTSEEEYYVLIPRSMVPSGSVEYNLTAGRLPIYDQDFARGDIRAGIGSYLTFGGGAEAVPQQDGSMEYVPYVQPVVRLGRRMIAEGTHTFGYASSGSLRYLFTNARSITFRMQKFHGSSVFNRTSRRFEASMNTSFPIEMPGLRLTTSLSVRNTHYRYNQDLFLYGSVRAHLPGGLTLQGRPQLVFRNLTPEGGDLIRSDVRYMLSRRFFRRTLIRPTLDYSHLRGEVTRYGVDIRSRLFGRSDLNISVQHEQRTGQTRMLFGFRFDLPFARHQSRVQTTAGGSAAYSQTTSGLLAWDRYGEVYTDNRTLRNKTILHVEPYLAGGTDEDRQALKKHADQLTMTVHDDLGRSRTYRDHVAHDLDPYREYTVEVNAGDFDNPLLRLQADTYTITLMPNVINRIRVPVTAVGEVAGAVVSDDKELALNNLPVVIKNYSSTFSETLPTYGNGYFYYVGLEPGEYYATIKGDELSARELHLQESLPFTVTSSAEGDIVDGLELKVEPIVTEQPEPAPEPEERPEPLPEVISTVYSLQAGAFRMRGNAVEQKVYLQGQLSEHVEIIYDPSERLYKIHVGIYSSYDEAIQAVRELNQRFSDLFRDAFIIRRNVEQIETSHRE
jgi:hypothetical protein